MAEPPYRPSVEQRYEPSPDWDARVDEAALERRLRLFAIPVTLGLMLLLARSPFLHGLLRIFFGMWLHELGHATAAWLCGHAAFPGPWATHTSEERSLLLALVIALGLGFLGVRAFLTERRLASFLWLCLLSLQLCCTVLLEPRAVRTLIYFCGDAGALVYGTLGMASVYAPAEGALRRGWLRWGFLVIGAGAFSDVLTSWLLARKDLAEIPLGENEGVGLSDATVLVDQLGWTEDQLVGRYLWLAGLCLGLLFAAYLFGLRRGAAERS